MLRSGELLVIREVFHELSTLVQFRVGNVLGIHTSDEVGSGLEIVATHPVAYKGVDFAHHGQTFFVHDAGDFDGRSSGQHSFHRIRPGVYAGRYGNVDQGQRTVDECGPAQHVREFGRLAEDVARTNRQLFNIAALLFLCLLSIHFPLFVR